MTKDSSYDDAEVRAFISRALEEQPKAGGVSHEDLLSIGSQVGLSRAAVEAAAHEVRATRLTTAAKGLVLARRRRGLFIHALVFALVNAFLFAINFLSTPGEWWVLFSIVGWGLGLALHAIFGLSASVSERALGRAKEQLRALEGESEGEKLVTERRGGMRVEGPLDQIEAPIETDKRSLPARNER